MFSISPAELLTIAVIALIVFGPRRLAEMARQAGKVTGELRRTADELRSGLQQELDDVKAPIDDLRTDLAAAGKGLIETAEGELRWVDQPKPKSTEGEPAGDDDTADQPDATGDGGDGGDGPASDREGT